MSLFENIRNFTNTKRITEKKREQSGEESSEESSFSIILLISSGHVALPIGIAIKISLTPSGEKNK